MSDVDAKLNFFTLNTSVMWSWIRYRDKFDFNTDKAWNFTVIDKDSLTDSQF